MRVKITACNNPSRWYADMIGITVPAVRHNGDGNFICDLGIISDLDCQVLEEDKPVTNPNKLAWKGTPGPWLASKTGTRRGPAYLGVVNSTTDGYQTVADVFGDHQAKMEANMAFVSAAPEAIEFIADWLYGIDGATLTHEAVEKLYERAEDILKKAYNF